MDLRAQLADLMKTRGYSQTAVSRRLGISTAALSQWIAGRYVGDSKSIDERVRQLIDRERERMRTGNKELPFSRTEGASRVLEACRIGHIENEIAVITGEAGTGKTSAARQYTAQNQGVILVEADLGYTAKVLFQELHRACGYSGQGVIHDMFTDVVNKLRDSGRLIIVDEAEHLPYRALELVRRIYDKAGIGIVLMGLPRLLQNLRGKRGEYAQLYSRVGLAVKLKDLNRRDVQTIVESVLPGSNGLDQHFLKGCRGNARTLSKLIYRSTRLAEINRQTIDKDLIERAAEMLII